MDVLIIAGAARHVDLTDSVHVCAAANVVWNLRVRFEVEHAALACLLSAWVGAVPDEYSVAQCWVDLFYFLDLPFCAVQISDIASEWQRFALEF